MALKKKQSLAMGEKQEAKKASIIFDDTEYPIAMDYAMDYDLNPEYKNMLPTSIPSYRAIKHILGTR